jgi:hypothetical protein
MKYEIYTRHNPIWLLRRNFTSYANFDVIYVEKNLISAVPKILTKVISFILSLFFQSVTPWTTSTTGGTTVSTQFR